MNYAIIRCVVFKCIHLIFKFFRGQQDMCTILKRAKKIFLGGGVMRNLFCCSYIIVPPPTSPSEKNEIRDQ